MIRALFWILVISLLVAFIASCALIFIPAIIVGFGLVAGIIAAILVFIFVVVFLCLLL